MFKKLNIFFEKLSVVSIKFIGNPIFFISSFAVTLIRAALGPYCNFSANWQLFINTTTTIINFFSAILILINGVKDGKAIQLKLNEIIRALDSASNRLINVEDLEEEELDILHKYYSGLSQKAKELKEIHNRK